MDRPEPGTDSRPDQAAQVSESATLARRSPRKRLLLAATAVFVVAGIAYGTWWTLVARHFQSTDDAYVHGDLVHITPQIPGTIIAVHADDTDYIEAGTPLAELDQADAQVALEQAQAELAQTVRQVSMLYAQNDGLVADIEVRKAQVLHARTELDRLQNDLKRRKGLARSGGISGEELLHAEASVKNAQAAVTAADAAVTAARAALAGNAALTANTTITEHPNVLLAATRVREAALNLSRTTLPAPVSGYIARRTAQLGQRVAAGTAIMSVVPLDRVWVDANFKEVQIGAMRIGQPVTLHADMYGKDVVYHGRVAGLSAGTGSAFALLPAQNASGNWIKVVQRVPVRITLDAQALRDNPLLLGLSMHARVDISDTSGPALAGAAHTNTTATTQAFEQTDPGISAMIASTITANLPAARAASGAPRAAVAGANSRPATKQPAKAGASTKPAIARTARDTHSAAAQRRKPAAPPRKLAAGRNAS